MSKAESTPMAATLVWLSIGVLTLVTFTFGLLAYKGIGLVAAVLIIALIKGQLVIDHFMMLRRGAPMWRMLLTGYLFTVGALIAISFVLAGL